MKEKTLIKLSFITSIIGIVLLLFIMDKIELSKSNISNLTQNDIDKKIKIKAELLRITETPGLYLLNVKDFSGEISVVVFKDESINLTKGDILEIEGQITSYKDKIEIIAKKIIVL